MLLTEAEGGRSSERVVSSTNLSRPQWVERLSMMTINDRRPSLEPWAMPLRRAFQEETKLLTLTRWQRCEKYDPNHFSKQFGILKGLGTSIGIAAEQASMVWACAAKRRWLLGEEMFGVWSWGSKTKLKTKEDLEIGCTRGLSST